MHLPQSRNRPSVPQVALAVLLGLVLLWLLRPFWSGLAWAVILASIFWPLARHFLGHYRALGAAGLSFLVVAVVSLPIAFLALELSQAVGFILPWVHSEMVRAWPFPSGLTHILPPAARAFALHSWDAGRHLVLHVLSGLSPSVEKPGTASVSAFSLSSLWHSGALVLDHSGWLFSLLGGAEHLLLNGVITIMVLYFLLLNGDSLRSSLAEHVQFFLGADAWLVLQRGVKILRGTFLSMVVTALFEGIAFWVAYAISGVPHAILWATVSGFLSVIPYGATLTFSLVSLWLWLAQGSWVFALVVFGSGYGITTVADNYVKPVLIGRSSRLSFVLIFLGILAGLSTLGILGVFVGPMLMGMGQAWWQNLPNRKEAGGEQ